MNLTSPTSVKSWCIENGFHPSKNLGQNFLVDKNILDAITGAAELRPGDRVLEIGPGLGVLTEGLLARGADVTAVEKDSRLAGRLADSLGNPPGLRVITADALELDWDSFLSKGPDAAFPAPARGSCFAACVSNLPYSVGTRILLDAALSSAAPARFVILVQTEVAERFAAQPGDPSRGQAGVWLQLDYSVTMVREVKASCFWPKPEVGSTIVRLDRKPCPLTAEERAAFFALTRFTFMHRRKQMGSSLRKAAPAPLACPPEELLARFARAGVDPQARAESLSNGQWLALARAFSGTGGGAAR
jgi:16S rRNA (adenine1518-N6/adenine1519-N6)-dimethyltransferase